MGRLYVCQTGHRSVRNVRCQAYALHIRTAKRWTIRKKHRKSRVKSKKKTVLVIRDGSRAAIRKRPAKGLLAGLYELPNLSGWLSQDEVLDWLKQEGLSPIRIRRLSDAKHIFSHIEWHMTGYVVLVEELENYSGKDMLFIEPKRTEEEYPIPAAFFSLHSLSSDQTRTGKI